MWINFKEQSCCVLDHGCPQFYKKLSNVFQSILFFVFSPTTSYPHQYLTLTICWAFTIVIGMKQYFIFVLNLILLMTYCLFTWRNACFSMCFYFLISELKSSLHILENSHLWNINIINVLFEWIIFSLSFVSLIHQKSLFYKSILSFISSINLVFHQYNISFDCFFQFWFLYFLQVSNL